MAYSFAGASQIRYARQCWPSGNEALPKGIVARTSNLEMRLWDSGIYNRISKRPLNFLAIAKGGRKNKFVNKIVAKAEAGKPMSDNAPQIKYDVFVSFRGEDIRSGFLGHLSEAFSQKQIYAFIDEKLKKGDSVWPSLEKAIEGSFISLIIFSKNYASSSWCLKELVKILECRDKYKRIVIPVFYNVEPTVVRHQNKFYAIAFVFHQIKYGLSMVKLWKKALEDSSNLSGIKSTDFRNDAEMLDEIVKQVLMRFSKHPINMKGLIGIGKPISDIESLLCQESKDVRVIGIWGMGGIGKTTIAEEVFNKLYSKYEGCCFLANVREELRRNGIISLKEQVFSTLLGEVVKINTPNGLSDYIKRRIGRQKVLIILDDVNDSDQIEILLGTRDWFGGGSRIIITTRDKRVLIANRVDDIYKVDVLSSSDALKLFNLKAFDQNQIKVEYHELSKRVVNYAKGIPLVLEVLGRLLCGKDKVAWESQLEILEKMPIKKVYDIMRLSYDDLDRKEQKVFLDVAYQESDNSVAVVLERLEDRALVSISKHNVVSMHDIIQEMAWEIVRQESSESGRHSRLGDPDEIYEVLKNDKGMEDIRSIKSHLPAVKKLMLCPNIFAKMRKLLFLDFRYTDGLESVGLFPQGLHSLPMELRYLRWECYPFKSLPEQFSTEKLVVLDMSYSQVEKLWSGEKNLMKLKEIILQLCHLKELPDLSNAANLKVLDARGCYQLTSVNPSILSLNMLEKLDLWYCISLTRLSCDSHSSSLRYLNLKECKNLREFSVTSENMIELDLSCTQVNALPTTFGCQRKLEHLNLALSYIESLPSSIKDLTRLQYLNISYCEKLQILPELPPSLETLLVNDCTSLKTVLFPSTVAKQFSENRKKVEFWNCLDLDEHSLMAIGLNAQINMMKFAYQHLSASKQDYNENFGDQAMYLYPGSNIPEWMMYKTTGDYIIIDHSSAPSCPISGFIFCFILGRDGRKFWCHKLQFNIIISDDEGNRDVIKINSSMTFFQIVADHVCLIYDQRCSCSLNSITKNLPKFKIKATAWFTSIFEGFGSPNRVVLKGFGVSHVNTSDYHKTVQQMD
ncbi:disease resistance-like protein DSC1 [Abrus precatorius]|uniref:Disease resistance-like protein DSC1 n=1 Tax=Abrus precatorius TaxID=3816 RepID=A0A8B8JZV5_ABRPR|nr:disease resistance-like protein DSC1 [Abrus precatorius]